jgi:hypothetical protein
MNCESARNKIGAFNFGGAGSKLAPLLLCTVKSQKQIAKETHE